MPDVWKQVRPADLVGRQPEGDWLGFQGPDQGYALTLARRFRDKLHVAKGETVSDAITVGVSIALRRASLFGRAPVSHDLTIAFTAWGLLDPSPPAELVEQRTAAFAGVGNGHHYREVRSLVDGFPEATLRMTPDAVRDTYDRGGWKSLLGR